ncbi:MAG: ABC transporter ATP-binding protein [Phycisphaerae bacterium]|jgi:ABC-type lipoprotein export system ATPase subunit|nr:ABC transporter ATP-binding protein [Phycisphaerae bacterium]
MSNGGGNMAVVVRKLHRAYRMGRSVLRVLRGVSFQVHRGEFVAVVGASGSGKSTLLHQIGLLDRPDKGQIVLDGEEVAAMSAAKRNAVRCRDIGFVFQFYHLLGEFNVLENVMLPAQMSRSTLGWLMRRKSRRREAMELLERLGLSDRIKHRPQELSGGERQRVAIARALINRPKVVLADEPTGNLDSRTGEQIMEVLSEFHRQGQTLLMVTHDAALAGRAERILHLHDGQLKTK